jgi:crotonobetainyl-CoA:carnitine CoA-transferase CaiB-like acyl-CoA transferase
LANDRGSDQPLEGIRIVELGIWIQGPLAAQILGDLGAEVIKIERPSGGDYTRGLTSLYGVPLNGDETGGLLWQLCNRNKRSMAVDLKQSRGQHLLLRLVQGADVFVTNLQPGALRKLRATPEVIMGANPRLIYAMGGGLGVEGDLAEIACQDTTAMAYSGFMFAVSDEATVPYYPPGAMIDILAATNLAAAVLGALHQRGATNQGQLVSTSLLHSALWLQMLNVGTIENQNTPIPSFDRAAVQNPLMNLYRCADGRWLALGMLIASSEAWKSFCSILGRPDLADDDRFTSNRKRTANAEELIPILTEFIGHLDRDVVVAAMTGADLACTPVNTPQEVLASDAVRKHALVEKTSRGTRFLRVPMNFRGNNTSTNDAPPLGGATFDILREVGVDSEEISALLEAGVVA